MACAAAPLPRPPIPTKPILIILFFCTAFPTYGEARRVPAVIVELALTKFLRDDEWFIMNFLILYQLFLK